ncbi:serine hydrolase domain-containing protein [Actinophytocola sp.]|uniref:serine hydrolase domain-containing protein n=1 Tax=Actinophytocola sp. TaxID=1872138 RepID=UPI00389AD666
MTDLRGLLRQYVDDGSLPGAVALVTRGDTVEFTAVGTQDGTVPMARDTIFRIASLTKPITAAAVLTLVEDGRLGLDDPVGRWLPEIAEPVVVRTPASPIDDVVPATRPVTVYDLLTSQAGWGFASDFSLPAVVRLFDVQRDGREVQSFPSTEVWLAELAQVPMLYQPGESWLYDTCSAIQGVLVARVSGQSLPDFLAERVFAPLGMADSAFVVPAGKRDRFASYYKGGALADGPDGQWSTMPAMPLGSGGLVGTVDDWLAFARMLLAGGVAPHGGRLLSAASVRLMTTDHTTPAHREIGALFLEGQGWGMGGSVDIAATDPWVVPGRYGWVGGTGTSAHVVPATGSVAILFTQVGMASPVAPDWMREFWLYSAGGGAQDVGVGRD